MSLTPLKTARLRGGLRRGYWWQGELRCEAAIQDTELGGARWLGTVGFGGGAAGSAGAGLETELIARVHLTEREEREHDRLGMPEPKSKTYFYGDAIDTWAKYAGEEGFGLRGKGGQRGWLGQWPSGPIRLAGPKARNE
jgi:hypothetical protein